MSLSKGSIKSLNKVSMSFGILLNNAMPKERVLQLISKLHPVKVKQPLVRVGPNGDGGYVMPDDFDGIVASFSPGIGPVSTFDEAIATKGIKVFMADASVEGPSVSHPLFNSRKKFLGSYNDETYLTLDKWVAECEPDGDVDLILQMDIENSEYIVIPSIPDDLLKRFRIIIVEFHGLHRLWDKFFFSVASNCFNKLLMYHHCVHIHPNNNGGIYTYGGIAIPKAMEFTFYRKDRSEIDGFADQFPHPLDCDNVNKKQVVLPKVWYRYQ
jgi:hypothetical protein